MLYGFPYGKGYPVSLGGGYGSAIPSTTVVTSPFPFAGI